MWRCLPGAAGSVILCMPNALGPLYSHLMEGQPICRQIPVPEAACACGTLPSTAPELLWRGTARNVPEAFQGFWTRAITP